MDSLVARHAEFSPPRWLRNPHLQSILPSLKWRRVLMRSRTRALRTAAREHILDCGDGVRLMGLYSPQRSTSPRPLVVLLHGWEGSADSLYVLSLGAHLYSLGYDIFRLNFRDHGPTHHLNRDIFHSCRIGEVVGAVGAVERTFAPARLHIAGFSLGGNFALRVAARANQAGIALHSAVGVCPVLSPRKTLAALENGWSLYQQYFVRKWKSSLRIKARVFREHYDFTDILRLGNLNDMTDVLVRRHSEYPDLHTYLEGYSILGNALRDLSVESHVLLAADDPIIPVAEVEQLPRSKFLSIQIAQHGGHCGFFDRFTGESWADRLVAEILGKSLAASELPRS